MLLGRHLTAAHPAVGADAAAKAAAVTYAMLFAATSIPGSHSKHAIECTFHSQAGCSGMAQSCNGSGLSVLFKMGADFVRQQRCSFRPGGLWYVPLLSLKTAAKCDAFL
mmetsp:Transcript_67128/g.147160  ORF Transcript_67128/g.147160 Transcript_67128/m.147160 type:complete len:109 (+) Transcript_67128:755-1081(+)